MAGGQEERLQSIIESTLHRDNLWQWCNYSFARIYRLRLCRHCYGIRRELARLHKQYVELRRRVGDRVLLASDLEMKYATALMMAELCQSSGYFLRYLPNKPISGLDLEFQLNHLSRQLIHKNLYSHLTHLLDVIPSNERRYFYFLLSLLSDEWARRHRRQIALGLVYNKTVEEVLEERARNSFRVENA